MFDKMPKLQVARIAGIPVRLDLTFLLVPYFVIGHRDLTTLSAIWPALVAGIVGIFLSILLHELGHALVAKRNAIGADQIVIGGFYGYVNFKTVRTTRFAMIRVLLAGPLANLLIFLALQAWLMAGKTPWHDPMLSRQLQVLAIINLAMFAFNLLPAFPLDGGKIAALLLRGLTTPVRSTMIVAIAGAILGGALVAASFALFHSIILQIIAIMIVMSNLQIFGAARKQLSAAQ